MTKIYFKTATINAEQFDGSDEMIEKYNITPPMPLDPDYTINTLEGDMVLGVGDWIATGVNGEHWPIVDDVFKKTYAEFPVIPKAVADWIDKCKHERVSISFAMYEDNFPNEVADYFRAYYTRDQWITIQDNFARAWLDGYIVEE